MTITRVADGVWELRTRHGQLIGRGDLYTVIMLWARTRRDGWSDVAHGQPATNPLSGRRTVECAEAHDCQCRAGSTPASSSSASITSNASSSGTRPGISAAAVLINNALERVSTTRRSLVYALPDEVTPPPAAM